MARLRIVLDRAISDSFDVESEFCVGDAEHDEMKDERQDTIDTIEAAIAALERKTKGGA